MTAYCKWCDSMVSDDDIVIHGSGKLIISEGTVKFGDIWVGCKSCFDKKHRGSR